MARSLTRAMKAIHLYPIDHPRVTDHLETFLESLEQCHDQDQYFVIGVDNNKLFVQDTAAENDELLADQLKNTLEERKIGSLVLERGVSREEVTDLLDLMTTRKEEVVEDDQLKPKLRLGFDHIQLNELEVQYGVSINTDGSSGEESETEEQEAKEEVEPDDNASSHLSSIEEKKEALTSLLSSDPDPDEIDDVVSDLLSGLDANPENLAEEGLEAIMKLLNQIAEHARSSGEELSQESFRKFFVQFILKIGLEGEDSFSEITEQAEASLDLLNESSREMLYDDEEMLENPLDSILQRVQPEDRGRVVAREIQKGTTSMNKLTQMIETIAPGEEDVVEVTASAVREMGQFTDPSEDESKATGLSSLFNALLANTPYQNPPVRIMVIDDDDKYDQYMMLLSDMNYYFDLYASGEDAWEALQSREGDELSYDLLITDIRLPDKTGLELLEDLNTFDNPPPVIVCTRSPEFQDAYEIATYPELEYLEKPVEEDTFRNSVQAFLPDDQEWTDRDTDHTERDMERARRIQQKLVKQETTEYPPFEVSTHHEAAEMVGGDYIDVIPMNEHEYLLTVADVSGTGVSASMVMVIVRSTLQMLSEQESNPRDILVEANRIISNEIDRSMFVSLTIGVLNTGNHTMQLVNAGHNHPLFWNQEGRNLSEINLSGMAIGVTDDRRFEDFLQERNVALNAGDAVIFYSDGIIQAKNPEEESFGDERFRRTIQHHADERAEDVVQGVVYEIKSFRKDAPLSDDHSMLVVKSS